LEDWDRIDPSRSVTLKTPGHRGSHQAITHAYFLEIGIASVVAVDAETIASKWRDRL